MTRPPDELNGVSPTADEAPKRSAGTPPVAGSLPRPASTVVLVRPAAGRKHPYEVFLVKRSPKSEFVGGVYVFPGGAVDPTDVELEPFCEDLDDEKASAILGTGRGGIAWYVAAARELFEEAGILLSRNWGSKLEASESLPPSSKLASRVSSLREALNRRQVSFREVLESLGVRLTLSELHWIAHWITPVGQPRRYDTRFFLCRVPEGQAASHEGVETTDSIWIAPALALKMSARGELPLIFPTVKNLEAIASFGTLDALVAWAASRKPQRVQPVIVSRGGEVTVVVPGDRDTTGDTGPPWSERTSADIRGEP